MRRSHWSASKGRGVWRKKLRDWAPGDPKFDDGTSFVISTDAGFIREAGIRLFGNRSAMTVPAGPRCLVLGSKIGADSFEKSPLRKSSGGTSRIEVPAAVRRRVP